MSENKSLILELNDLQQITEISWNQIEGNQCMIKIDSGFLKLIKVQSNSVLEIQFQRGRILLDINQSDLENIIWEQ